MSRGWIGCEYEANYGAQSCAARNDAPARGVSGCGDADSHGNVLSMNLIGGDASIVSATWYESGLANGDASASKPDDAGCATAHSRPIVLAAQNASDQVANASDQVVEPHPVQIAEWPGLGTVDAERREVETYQAGGLHSAETQRVGTPP